MNIRLCVLGGLSVLTLVAGVFAVVAAVLCGGRGSGFALFLAAALVSLGCSLIVAPFRFVWKPSASVASDIVTVFSLFIFGATSLVLGIVFPDAGTLPKIIGISTDNAESARTMMALLVAWATLRSLRKYLAVGALLPHMEDKKTG